jgi:hypothetical protein
MMAVILERLLAVLAALAFWWRDQQRREEAEQHEDEMQKIQDDPAQWFDGHFNGRNADRVQPDSNTHSRELHNASATGKADAAEPNRNG